LRGSAEMGAWKAISELGLEEHVKGAVGSSIGSIMSAMFVAGEYEKSMTLWSNITEEQVFPDSASQRTLEQDNAIIAQMYKYNSSIKDIAIIVDSLVNGTRSNEGYRNIINENVDLDKIMASDKELIITTIDITKLKLLKANREEMTRDLIPVYILASGACVPVLPAVTINKDTCIDSGYIDPVPIDVARQYGATKIIAIDINTNASLSDEEAAARDLIYIHPNVQGSFLDFDQETVQANITEGYNAVMNAFKNVTIIPKTTTTN
jgi:NTE family protein